MDIRSAARDILSRYRTPRYRGKNGPFENFQARDLSHDSQVVINILPTLLAATPDLQQAYAKLSRTLLHLEHPRIARALEIAQKEGVPYLVSQAAKNIPTLAARLTDKPIDLERAGALVAKIGSALEYAGQQGLPHGGLTPSQVLLDDKDEATVTGFGLATLAALAGIRSADPNAPYIAPEQRFADHAPGTRGDVYSLAAVLYRLVAGRSPDPDPRRIVPAGKLNPLLPPALSDVIAHALAADPQERYQSADDFVLAVRSAIRAPRSGPVEAILPASPAATSINLTPMPAPLPFPEPLALPQADLTPLSDATRLAEAMLESASHAVAMPEPLPMPVIEGEEQETGAAPPDQTRRR